MDMDRLCDVLVSKVRMKPVTLSMITHQTSSRALGFDGDNVNLKMKEARSRGNLPQLLCLARCALIFPL